MRFPVISKESQKNRQIVSTTNSKSPKNEAKQKIAKKRTPSRKGVMRDVTRDSVTITRDLAVIRNHTDCKSQGHKTAIEHRDRMMS